MEKEELLEIVELDVKTDLEEGFLPEGVLELLTTEGLVVRLSQELSRSTSSF